MMQAIVAKTTDNINNLNNEGYTPLHLSCQWDKPDCVKALLAAGADANIQSAKTKGPTIKSEHHFDSIKYFRFDELIVKSDKFN